VEDPPTCVILAGGLGTRLRSVFPDTPKPMVPVNGRPFLEYLLTQMRLAGCTDVILCVGYRADVIQEYFNDGRRYGLQIGYSCEQHPLGTAGALFQARHLIRTDPFIVMNGDSYCAVEIPELLRHHHSRAAMATIVTTRVPDQSRYGSVLLGPGDVILRFSEKKVPADSFYINAGIYVLRTSVLNPILPGHQCSLELDIFPPLVGRGLYAFTTSAVFIDIGTPSDLDQAQTLLAGQSLPLGSQTSSSRKRL
jgi:NDP-sugar pyrophosphorylase family protein